MVVRDDPGLVFGPSRPTVDVHGRIVFDPFGVLPFVVDAPDPDATRDEKNAVQRGEPMNLANDRRKDFQGRRSDYLVGDGVVVFQEREDVGRLVEPPKGRISSVDDCCVVLHVDPF